MAPYTAAVLGAEAASGSPRRAHNGDGCAAGGGSEGGDGSGLDGGAMHDATADHRWTPAQLRLPRLAPPCPALPALVLLQWWKLHVAPWDALRRYALVGVLVHSGDTELGHYYSFIKARGS